MEAKSCCYLCGESPCIPERGEFCLEAGCCYGKPDQPKPVVPPTLTECLDALAALHKGAPRNGAMIEDILTRAGRLPVKEVK